MEIENHKEEVPFGHYEELFCKADAQEMAARCGAQWDGKEFFLELLGKRYAISHPEYGIREVDPEQRIATGASALAMTEEETIPSGGAMGAPPGRIQRPERVAAVSRCQGAPSTQADAGHRNRTGKEREDKHCARGVSGNLPLQTFLLRYLLESKAVRWQGNWKTFREMPWGELYIKPYTGRVLTRAAFTFGTRLDVFKAACQKMGAVAVSHGDAGFQFRLIGGYEMQILVWEGDDEFPPSAQVLYSDNFEQGFAPEDRVVAGDILITAIKGNM